MPPDRLISREKSVFGRLVSVYCLVQTALSRAKKAILTALSRDTVLIRPPYLAQKSDFDRLMLVYRLIQTALSRAKQAILTTLYRYTALFRPPYVALKKRF